MGLRSFERRLERVVEGAFARAFRSGLRPVELGRRLSREMDEKRTVGVNGKTTVPNHFTIRLSPSDLEEFSGVVEGLIRELCNHAHDYARDESYSFMGPVRAEFVPDERFRSGSFELTGTFVGGGGGAGAGSLVLPSGDRMELGEDVVSIGRDPGCTIVLNDPNASRNHAEIRPQGDGFIVRDLGSTNGTKVNTIRVVERLLDDGDDITIGNAHVRFEAS